MRRSDVTVLSISAALAAVVVALVVSSFVIDRSEDSATDRTAASTSSLLVVTWGPSLCAVEESNPGCRSGHVQNLGSTLIVHGLWPQPRTEQFCGVPEAVVERARDLDSTDMPTVDLPAQLSTSLQSMMSDASVMAPHEWYTHGTCSGVAPDVYFGDLVSLSEQVGDLLNPVFRDAEHSKLSLGAVRDRFDTEFGGGAGNRVGLSCRDVDGQGVVVYEVHVSLPPIAQFRSEPGAGTSPGPVALGDLLAEGPSTFAGCRRGIVP